MNDTQREVLQRICARCKEEHAMKFSEVWVCVDCYFVHHFGEFSEESMVFGLYSPDGPNDEESRLARAQARQDECMAAYIEMGGDRYVSDNTDSETGEGIHEFSWSWCHCCRSSLGGSRYRMAVEEHSES